MYEEDFKNGGKGIDTQDELDKISYRPKIKPERKEIHSGYADRQSTEKEEKISALTAPIGRLLWNDFVDVVNTINELEKEIEKRLHNTTAKVPVKMQSEVQEAAKRYGYTVKEEVPFSLYKEALKDKPCQQRQIIMDVFENYHADVHGSLLAETYPDVIEMKEDWGDMFTFINNGVFAQIVSQDDLPSEIKKEDSKIDVIEKKELEMKERYQELILAISKAREVARDLSLKNPSTREASVAESKLSSFKKELEHLERRLHSKKETVEMSHIKAVRAQTSLQMITNAIDFSPYAGEYHNILVSLLKQYATRQSLANGLRKIQTLLKLSVDGKIDRLNEKKSNLRNLSGRANRKRINDTLTNGVHLNNEISGEVTDLLESSRHEESMGFDMVAEHIMDSIEFSQGLYKNNATDFHKMHSMEADLRQDKLSSLLDKDSAREIYKLLDKLLAYSKEKDSWPSHDNLSQWVSGFLASQNLS